MKLFLWKYINASSKVNDYFLLYWHLECILRGGLSDDIPLTVSVYLTKSMFTI